MEKENSALEKTKKAQQNSGSKSKSSSKKSHKKSDNNKARIKEQKREERQKELQKRKEEKAEKRSAKQTEKERIKQEKEKVRANKRLELARIKANKKAEKEKAQANKLREKNRSKAQLREQKAQEKKEKRESRERRRKDNKGLGGWLAAVISLGVATLILSGILTYTFLMPTPADTALESTYQRSFYDVVERVDNIDLNMSKFLASNDNEAKQTYLLDLAVNSELAENDLQQLPLQDENKYYTAKLVNQIGDFSKYLNKKLINGEKLSQTDIESFKRLYEANITFKNTLQSMMAGMGVDYSFSNMNNNDIVLENFKELQNLSVEYPELIYDGPFSDGQNDREIKGLTGEEISEVRAKEIFSSIFADKNLEKVENAGSTSANLECYNVQAMVDGDVLFAQISKKGGKLIMFDYAGECNNVNYSEDYAIEKGKDFLTNKLSIADMKEVWVNLSGNVYTVNYAYEKNDVIVYSDLIKVRICADSGNVLGLEATSYWTNHVERAISKPELTKSQAAGKINTSIELQTGRLVVVPVGQQTEKLCYEFVGTSDGETYFIYIDAINGKQVEMFRVIDSEQGTMLM